MTGHAGSSLAEITTLEGEVMKKRRRGSQIRETIEQVAFGLMHDAFSALPLKEIHSGNARRLDALSHRFVEAHREEVERMLVDYLARYGFPAFGLVSEALADRFAAFVKAAPPEEPR